MTDFKIEQRTINKITKIIESGKPGAVSIKGKKVTIDPQQKVIRNAEIIIPAVDEKTGGFLPLLALVPLIAKAVAAAGILTGGVATAAKVGYDISKGSGLAPTPPSKDDGEDDKAEDVEIPCKAKIIDAILTLHKAGFTIMRM